MIFSENEKSYLDSIVQEHSRNMKSRSFTDGAWEAIIKELLRKGAISEAAYKVSKKR